MHKVMTRIYSVLTNGEDAVEIRAGRYTCGITPPPGMVFSVVNGEYFLNGKPAWVEIRVR